MNTSTLTSNAELSANEIESKLSAVLQENMYLKGNVQILHYIQLLLNIAQLKVLHSSFFF